MTALHLQALWRLGGAKNGRAAIPNGTPDGAVHLSCFETVDISGLVDDS